MSLNWILIIGGAVLVLVEIILGAATGFDLVLIGSALMLGGVLGLLTHAPTLGVATAGVLALLYVFLGRKRIRGRWARPGIPSNTDALLGKYVRVVERISADHPGRVKYEGDEWRAQLARPAAGALEEGTTAQIARIDGVTVYVEPAEGHSGGSAS